MNHKTEKLLKLKISKVKSARLKIAVKFGIRVGIQREMTCFLEYVRGYGVGSYVNKSTKVLANLHKIESQQVLLYSELSVTKMLSSYPSLEVVRESKCMS